MGVSSNMELHGNVRKNDLMWVLFSEFTWKTITCSEIYAMLIGNFWKKDVHILELFTLKIMERKVSDWIN